MRRAALCAGTAMVAWLACGANALAAAQPNARPIGSPTSTDPGNTQTTAQGLSQIGRGSDGDATAVAEVVVTGSLIRGAAEQSALPVQVIGQEDLQKQGSPSTVELVKALPATGGVIGDANGFTAGRTEGSASINLRNLGANRNLVLFNGRRVVESGAGGFVDLNMFSPAAIGRVEVLKDGAAATYGSDAIGGVVNFITRKNFDGLEVGGDYSGIEGSSGDYTLRALYGRNMLSDRLNILVGGSFQHRAQLETVDRNFATPKYQNQAEARAAYLYNPQGGWSAAANPGTYAAANAMTGLLTAGTTSFVDPGCEALGELRISNTQCLFRYIDQYNLVEEQNLAQVYGELNFKVTDKINFHLETMAGHTEVFHIAQTASYGPNQYPTASVLGGVALPASGGYFIPASNPGLATLLALNATNPLLATSLAGAARTGVVSSPFFQRPLGVGGNPLYNNGAQENKRFLNQYRVSADLNGRFDAPWFGEIGWDTAFTYGRSDYDSTNPDFLVNRVQLAYRGLGSRFDGPQCDISTGTPGQGNCFYFNPFSTGVAVNPSTGQVNPQYNQAVALDPRVINDPEVIRWMYGADPQRVFTEKQLMVIDGLLNGTVPLKLWGDNFSWAIGYQYRDQSQQTTYSAFTDNSQFPCINSIIDRAATCSVRNGPYAFYGNYNPVDIGQQTHAVFGELNVTVFDGLQFQFAVRHEDSQGGETTNPKVAGRWQATSWLALRGSAGTAFRAAPVGALIPNAVTALSFISQIGSYRPFDNFGNPNLVAETANTYNAGGIVNFRNFSASLDYWRFEFENPIGGESGINILNSVFPTGQPNRCNDPAFAGLISRITFAGPCSAANLVRVRTQTINGAPVTTEGLDGAFDVRFRDPIGGGRITMGGDVSYTLNFNVGTLTVEGVPVVPAFNATGKLNAAVAFSSLPRWKGQFFAEYNRGPQNLRFTVKYIDSMRDQRDNLFASTNNGQGVVTRGKVIPEFITVDAVYRHLGSFGIIYTASVVNMFDEDPPFARLDYSYDPFTANPLGRVFKFGLLKRF